MTSGDEIPIQLTLVTATQPKRLTKLAKLVSGELEFEHGGYLISGEAKVHSLNGHQGLSELLSSLDASQALLFGVPGVNKVGLTTDAEWQAQGRPDDPIPRTNETFDWPEGSAVMMLDYDPEEGKEVQTPETLVDAVRHAVPGLRQAAMLHMPSASSFIYSSDTGEQLTGLRGQRLYLIVNDGRDIPRAGQVIFQRLWLAGYGHIKISSAGSLLPRTLVDGAVWQPSRLDFASGAECVPPLVQKRGAPRLFEGQDVVIDTATAIPNLSEREAKVFGLHLEAAREEKAEEAATIKEAWLERRIDKMAGMSANEAERKNAKAQLETALETRALPGRFILQVQTDGKIAEVTVDEVLASPQKYHRQKTRDAFEPDYDGGRLVGMLFLDGPKKTLHSFARGGVTYALERKKVEIEIRAGQLDEAVRQTIEILRDDPHIFDLGGSLVLIDKGMIYPMDQYLLEQKLSELIQYGGFRQNGSWACKDPPAGLSKRLLSMGGLRALKPLLAVVSAPTLRPDGSVLDVPGYDPETQLFLHLPSFGSIDPIPLEPNREQVVAALRALEFPFLEFPFVDLLDRAVFLSALLTAVVRGSLSTAPAFGFDAPVQGSGKTLLAQCIAVLAGATEPSVYPHVSGRDDEEVRKRLMSFFRTGATAMVWDNVLGTFDSAALAATLTSETFADRVLGKSESLKLPNKALFLLTGNNLTLQDDLVRRILICRIDPKTDQPFKRRFDIDPLEYVREHRVLLVSAALTVLRGYLSSGFEAPPGRLASFEAWSDLVRNAVCWIAATISPGTYQDPMKAIDRAMENDPAREATENLLSALHDLFGAEAFTSADVFQKVGREPDIVSSGKGHVVYEALTAISPTSTKSATTIGKLLGYRVDRVVNGLVLRKRTDGHSKKSVWNVEQAQ